MHYTGTVGINGTTDILFSAGVDSQEAVSKEMPIYARRSLLRSSLVTAAALGINASGTETERPVRKSRIFQSVSRWCYDATPLPQLCAYVQEID